MAALFVAQSLNIDLTLGQQLTLLSVADADLTKSKVPKSNLFLVI
jgi:Na+/H+-dicarboxylate symporter